MSSRLREMAAGLGVPGAAEVQVCGATAGNEAYDYWHFLSNAHKDIFHTSIITAEAALTTNRNDVLLLTPENHSLASALTWDLNMSHFIGMYGSARQNMRSRIGMSADFSPMLTMSGYGNTLQNLYFMHGRGSATNLIAMTDTGGRNSYHNCHWNNQDGIAMDEAGYDMLYLNNNELYFKDCIFGTDGATMTDGTLVKFGKNIDPPRAVFENCVFMFQSDATDPTFIDIEGSIGRCWLVFKGCTFLNAGTAVAVGIDGTGLTGQCNMYFDSNCSFTGITNICSDGPDAYIHMPVTCTVAAILTNLHTTYPDTT